MLPGNSAPNTCARVQFRDTGRGIATDLGHHQSALNSPANPPGQLNAATQKSFQLFCPQSFSNQQNAAAPTHPQSDFHPFIRRNPRTRTVERNPNPKWLTTYPHHAHTKGVTAAKPHELHLKCRKPFR